MEFRLCSVKRWGPGEYFELRNDSLLCGVCCAGSAVRSFLGAWPWLAGGARAGWGRTCTWPGLFLVQLWSQPDPPVSLQEFTATERELKKQMSVGELCHPVPQSFAPIKTFFKGLVEAMQSMIQTPLEVRVKDSKSPCDRLCGPYSLPAL